SVEEGVQVGAGGLRLQDGGHKSRLPQLGGRGAREVAGGRLVGPAGGLLQLVAGLVQDAGDGGGAGGQGGAAQEHVADALAAPVGVGLLQQEDGPFGQLGELAACRGTFGAV